MPATSGVMWEARRGPSRTTATATPSTRPTEYLQRLHAAVPWLVTWDDHEVDNNYAGTRDEALDPDFHTATRSRISSLLRAYAASQAGAPDTLGRRLAGPLRLRTAGALSHVGRSPAPNAASLPASRPRRRQDHRRALPGAARPGADDARPHAGAMAGARNGDDRRALELSRSADADGAGRGHGRRPQAFLV